MFKLYNLLSSAKVCQALSPIGFRREHSDDFPSWLKYVLNRCNKADGGIAIAIAIIWAIWLNRNSIASKGRRKQWSDIVRDVSGLVHQWIGVHSRGSVGCGEALMCDQR